MTPTDGTFIQVMKLGVDSGESSITTLFLYYALHEGESPTLAEIRKATGLNAKTTKAGSEVLEELGFISRKAERTNKKTIEVFDTPFSFSLAESITTLISKYSNRYVEGVYSNGQTKLNAKTFVLADVENDKDWSEIQTILLKYFKAHQVHPQNLVSKKQYFSRLMEVWEELGPEGFDKYAEWYRVNKYPQKKFAYGLFLHFGVVGEYQDISSGDDDRYMNTGSAEQREKFDKEAEKSLESLKEIVSGG